MIDVLLFGIILVMAVCALGIGIASLAIARSNNQDDGPSPSPPKPSPKPSPKPKPPSPPKPSPSPLPTCPETTATSSCACGNEICKAGEYCYAGKTCENPCTFTFDKQVNGPLAIRYAHGDLPPEQAEFLNAAPGFTYNFNGGGCDGIGTFSWWGFGNTETWCLKKEDDGTYTLTQTSTNTKAISPVVYKGIKLVKDTVYASQPSDIPTGKDGSMEKGLIAIYLQNCPFPLNTKS